MIKAVVADNNNNNNNYIFYLIDLDGKISKELSFEDVKALNPHAVREKQKTLTQADIKQKNGFED